MISHQTIQKRVRALGGYQAGGHRKASIELAQLLTESDRFSVEDFSLEEAFRGLVPGGNDNFHMLSPKAGVSLFESESALDMTAFSALTSRVIFSRLKEGYTSPEFVASRIAQTISSRLERERMPGLGGVPDQFATAIHELEDIPYATIDDEEIESVKTEKRARILAISKEAIFFDRTGALGSVSARLGEALGRRKEKRILDTMYGLTSAPNQGVSYIYKGTTYGSYQTSTPWINDIASNALDTWNDVDECEALLGQMLDPTTGDPMDIMAKHALVMPAKRKTAETIFNAIQVQSVPALAARGSLTVASNPVAGIQYFTSAQAYRQVIASGVAAANAANYWLYGDLTRAFGYVENWPITISRAPENSEAEFKQDVAVRFKVSERGTPVVLEPRAVIRCRA
jgi:hypothetical protein